MYAKNLALLIAFTIVNSSFGETTNNNINHSPFTENSITLKKLKLQKQRDAAFYRQLEKIAPDKSIKYMTLQQELDKLHTQESNSLSKPGMGAGVTLTSLAVEVIAALLPKGEPQAWLQIIGGIGIIGGLAAMTFCGYDTNYLIEREKVTIKMNELDLSDKLNPNDDKINIK